MQRASASPRVRGTTRAVVAFALLLAGGMAIPAQAGNTTPHLLPLQGAVGDGTGTPVASGDLVVRIYDSPTGGILVHDSGSDFLGAITAGRFDVQLGAVTPLGLDNTRLYHLEIEVDGTEILGDAAAGRHPFYPGGGDHDRTDLEDRLSALETELGVSSPASLRTSRSPAFTDSGSAYTLSYGLLGIGATRGSSQGYTVEGTLLLQPVGEFTAGSLELRLGPSSLEEVQDALLILSPPDSVRPGTGSTLVVEVLDALGSRLPGVGGGISFTSLSGISSQSGPVTENPDTTYSIPFTTTSTGLDSVIVSMVPGTSSLRDTVVFRSTWFPARVRLTPLGPTLIQEGDTLVLTAEILDGQDRRVPDESVPLEVTILSGTGSLGPAVLQPDTTWTVPFTAGSVPETVRVEVHDPDAAVQDRDTVTVVVTDRALITSVLDVGNDQGRWVRIIWEADSRDALGASPVITEYVVWRRVDDLPSTATTGPMTLATYGAKVLSTGEEPSGPVYLSAAGALWEPVGPRVYAMLWETYASVVPTLADSTIAQGMHWSVFFVSAHTANSQIFFSSEPDSGYSLDNLAPAAPTGLAVEGNGLLVWNEAPESDFDSFTVYGSASETFGESAEVLGYTVVPSFDLESPGHAHYFVTASDFSGNEGEAAGIGNVVAVPGGNDSPTRWALHAAWPNPVRATSALAFDLPEPARVRLRIFDVTGRTVATLVDDLRPAGHHLLTWSGRDDTGRALPGGVYFYRLDSGTFSQTRRLVLLR